MTLRDNQIQPISVSTVSNNLHENLNKKSQDEVPISLTFPTVKMSTADQVAGKSKIIILKPVYDNANETVYKIVTSENIHQVPMEKANLPKEISRNQDLNNIPVSEFTSLKKTYLHTNTTLNQTQNKTFLDSEVKSCLSKTSVSNGLEEMETKPILAPLTTQNKEINPNQTFIEFTNILPQNIPTGNFPKQICNDMSLQSVEIINQVPITSNQSYTETVPVIKDISSLSTQHSNGNKEVIDNSPSSPINGHIQAKSNNSTKCFPNTSETELGTFDLTTIKPELDLNSSTATSLGKEPQSLWYKSKAEQNKMVKPEKTFTCDICGLVFFWRPLLTGHRRSHFKKFRQIKCDICGETFTLFCDLNEHKKTHGPRPYSCDQCDKAYTVKDNLVTHKKKHSGRLIYINIL